jgi:hypothetical protein
MTNQRSHCWDQRLTDYGLCLETCVTTAGEHCRGGINERWVPVWLPMLQRGRSAWDDYA